MEKYQESLEKAKKSIQVADHMLTMTYPLIQDPKLLLAVVEDIFLGLTNAIGALLHFERHIKTIPPFHENFESKFNLFKMRCVDRHKISRGYLNFILEIKQIVEENRQSPITFSRKDKYVICSENYSLKELSVKELKTSLEKAKLFIHEICSIIEKNERVLGKSKGRA